jgi:UDP-glucose 4-epimerase
VALVENPRGNETLVDTFTVETTTAREQLGWDSRESVRASVRALLRSA